MNIIASRISIMIHKFICIINSIFIHRTKWEIVSPAPSFENRIISCDFRSILIAKTPPKKLCNWLQSIACCVLFWHFDRCIAFIFMQYVLVDLFGRHYLHQVVFIWPQWFVRPIVFFKTNYALLNDNLEFFGDKNY